MLENGRPFVSLKLAATLDGRIATKSGESRWITGEKARARVHGLRARADGIAVGSKTAKADDPELSVRRGGRVLRRPVRVVFDSSLRLPLNGNLTRDFPETTWVLCGARSPSRKRAQLEKLGVRVLTSKVRSGHLDLPAALARLAEEGLTEIFVEGGGGLAAALLRAGCVDELHWFLAPSLLGEEGRPVLGPLEAHRLAQRIDLDVREVARVDGDLYVRGVPGRR